MTKKHTVVCLCGSTRFKDLFLKTAAAETLKGNLVLTPLTFSQSEGWTPTAEQLAILVSEHNQKIEMCDEILVLNVDGIGESTKNEIHYAEKLGKRIRYLYKTNE